MTQPTRLQKAIAWMFTKATGFPPWTGGFTTANYAGQLAHWNGQGPDKAMQLAAVYGSIMKRAGTLSSLPLHVYRDTPQGRVRATEEQIYTILHDSPNAAMTSNEWRGSMILGHDMYGGGFSEIGRMGKRVVSLYTLDASKMRVFKKDGAIKFQYWYDSGKSEEFPEEKILHFRNYSLDGVVGLTPIQYKAVNLGLAAQDHGTSFLKNGARLSVAMCSPSTAPAPEVQERFRKTAEELYSGTSNAGRMMFLWGGMKPEAFSMSPADAQLMEQMKLSAVDICVLFDVPPFILGIGDKAPTYASAEQFQIQFATHCIKPLASRFEQRINKSVLAGTGLYCEFDLAGLLRGDAASQSAFISTMVQNGVMTRNEARRLFNLSDMEGGDELTVQSNMLDLSQLQSIIAKPAGGANV
jgi:HK97 family phage portal protein